jgi:organic radical activating enzyme|tara:strand:- start:2140 stop:3372 length:1233 start_codon:yes stop_codon:yes gene_type:complete
MDKRIHYKNLESLKQSGDPVVIFKIVRETEAIANACRDMGILVVAFCDHEKRKTNENFCGLEVIHTSDLPKRFPKARIIISSQYVSDSMDQLSELGYNEFYSPLKLLENYDVNKHQHLISKTYMKTQILSFKKSHEAYFDENKTYMRSLDVMITTRCSLKCESCSNLMQYYVNPENSDHKKILDEINIITNHVDDISEFRVIGGEPMMNKAWADITYGIVKNNPRRKVFIYTNGTIPAKEEQLEMFHGKNVNFVITDYGKLSRNIDKLKEKLTKHDIAFVSTPVENWVDCSNIKHHKRSVSQLQEVYKTCSAKYLYTLLDGKLYSCPFIANADKLNAIPDNPGNYVDLYSDAEKVKLKIKKLVKGVKFLPACDFCDGRPYNSSSTKGYDGRGMITPAIQTPQVLPYKVYK